MRVRVQLMFVCVLILGLTLTAFAQSDRENRLIEANKISFRMDFFEAPTLPSTNGIPVASTSDTKWLTALIEYVPTLVYENRRSGGKRRVRWLDELSITIHLILPTYPEYGRYAMISGKQVFWSVPEDGRTHRAFFAVPPQILKRYATFEKMNKSTASSLLAMLEFRTKDQVLLARYIYIPKGMSRQEGVQLLSQIMNSNVGFLKLPEAVLPKEKTPWNLVEVDSFDLSKSAVEGK